MIGEESYNIHSTNLKDFVKNKNNKNSNINTTYTNTSVHLNNGPHLRALWQIHSGGGGGDPGHDQAHHRPARVLRAEGRPHHRHGQRLYQRLRHARGASCKQRNLPRGL